MEKDPTPEERTRAASERADDARRLAESLEERAEDMHRAAAAAQASVAQFAEMVREHEPDVASKLDIDPERYRRRAASEIERAQHAHQRREEDARADAADAGNAPDTKGGEGAAQPSDAGDEDEDDTSY